jgi:uncharacterized protein YjbJ (UPF0337 family)
MRASRARAAAMEVGMDWNRVEGNWKQFEGRIKEKYGIGKDRAKRNVDDWLETLQ